MEDGYWNGVPTQVRKVWGVVDDWDQEKHPSFAWWRELSGRRIAAVEVILNGVNFGGGVEYLFDEDGSGWHKVTEGRGSPRLGHRSISIHNIVDRE